MEEGRLQLVEIYGLPRAASDVVEGILGVRHAEDLRKWFWWQRPVDTNTVGKIQVMWEMLYAAKPARIR